MLKNRRCYGGNIYIDDIIVIGHIYEESVFGTIKTIK